MKLLVAGSRTYSNQLITVVKLLDDLIVGVPDAFGVHHYAAPFLRDQADTVISGCAAGIDHAAIVWAENRNIPCTKMPANWKQHGIKAGFMRNEEMAKLCDYAIIIWDGKSTGTRHMMDMLNKYDKEYLLWDKLPVRKNNGPKVMAVAM